MTIEIVDLPIPNGDKFHGFLSTFTRPGEQHSHGFFSPSMLGIEALNKNGSNWAMNKIPWLIDCFRGLYPKPNGFHDHYPYEKWLFHWRYTLFSDKTTMWAIKDTTWWIDCEKGDLILSGLLGIIF